ncbi:hypothetical protein FB107DRAFT_278958 [Schizophyllum commune]
MCATAFLQAAMCATAFLQAVMCATAFLQAAMCATAFPQAAIPISAERNNPASPAVSIALSANLTVKRRRPTTVARFDEENADRPRYGSDVDDQPDSARDQGLQSQLFWRPLPQPHY